MFKKSPSTEFISVENLQKQVNNAVSLFSTILDNLKKSQDSITVQIDARDAEIARLSEERQNLEALWQTSARVIDKIGQIIS